MQIAMLGLGRMGANMAQRLLRGAHKVVVYDVDPRRATELAAHGATPATTLDEVVAALQPPRVVWTMVPAGRITEELIVSLAAKLSRGDLIIDGGNSNFKESMRRA
ncbi:MAG TPA: NAD(P)-binding domain-containing protein, partial [Myxococcales bacterium]